MTRFLRKYTDKNYSENFYPVDYITRPIWDLENYLSNLTKYVERKEDDLSRALGEKDQDYLLSLISKTTNRALCLALLIEMKKEGLPDHLIVKQFEERRCTNRVGFVTASDVLSGEMSSSAPPEPSSPVMNSLRKTENSSKSMSLPGMSIDIKGTEAIISAKPSPEQQKKALDLVVNSIKKMGNVPMPYPGALRKSTVETKIVPNFNSFEVYDQPKSDSYVSFSFNEDGK